MKIKPFAALRPPADLAARVSCPPYDVVDSEQARQIAEGNEQCFLRVTKPEIEFPAGTDAYSDPIYRRAAENFTRFIKNGWFKPDAKPALYIYRQILGKHTQTGLVALCNTAEYNADIIKKHEKTLKKKEDDRTRHTATIGANAGPVFLTYRRKAELDHLVERATTASAPEFSFNALDGVVHQGWSIADTDPIVNLFASIPCSYVADGHHRAASAARVSSDLAKANPRHTGEEDYNWFLCVLFPSNQLRILPYNRLVRDLNGLTPDAFLKKVSTLFTVRETRLPHPVDVRHVCMYTGGKWYELSWPVDTMLDPVSALDVSVLQDRLLGPVLGIDDPRTNERISFKGGFSAVDDMIVAVDSGKAAVAFSMYPTTVDQMMDVADAGLIMPPKSTWFEPKLRSGLFVNRFANPKV